jgi:8-oxo-dGTP pyrophosphatase MutT (NUDIX family)
MLENLNDNPALIRHIVDTLHQHADATGGYLQNTVDRQIAAGVLLLLGTNPDSSAARGEPCIVLNKRSLKVKQPGDLCFPGGSVLPLVDSPLARLLSLPITSLGRWQSRWKNLHGRKARLLALFWATGLRESLEEMRLNPFGVRFLGPLPPQRLVMFQRTIYPIVAWIKRQKRFFPNWEVEKILHIPLRCLLEPANYGRYRLHLQIPAEYGASDPIRDYPCFRFQTPDETEILWGATFRITALFLDYVFQFKLPALDELPVINGSLDQHYLTGH